MEWKIFVFLVLVAVILLSGCPQPDGNFGVSAGQAKTLVSEKGSGDLMLLMPNENPAWSDDGRVLVFPSMSNNDIWAVNVDGDQPWKLSNGKAPVNDPKSNRILYYAYQDIDLVNDSYVIESVSLEGGDSEFYARIEAPGSLLGFSVSPDGSMIFTPGGYLVKEVVPGKEERLSAEKVLDGGLGGFSSDSRYFIYLKDDKIYRYDTERDSSDFLMDAECWGGFDYCASKNWVVCTISEVECNPIVIYDLETKQKKQIACERAATNVKWAPDCSAIAYRAHNHLEGAILNVINVS